MTTGMFVPKAAMYEDHLASAPENNVRLAREFRIMQCIPKTEAVDQAPNLYLVLGGAHNCCGPIEIFTL